MKTVTEEHVAEIHAFAHIARAFVELLDTEGSRDDLIFGLDELLPRLYLAGTCLSAVLQERAETSEPALDAPVGPEHEVLSVQAGLLERLDEGRDTYHVLTYEGPALQDIDERSLSQDLAELYVLLREPFEFYELASPRFVEASGEGWRQAFERVWGPRLPFLLAAINRDIYSAPTTEVPRA